MAYTLPSLHSDAAARSEADNAFAAHSSVRSYSGEHQAHAHGHAQILYALQGRMELEVGGRSAFVDAVSGMLIPAGMDHGYLAAPRSRVFVIDAPAGPGLDRMRRFSVPPLLRGRETQGPAAEQLAQVLQAPGLLARRGLDVQRLAGHVQATLHEEWPTARLAALCHMSTQRFHARFVELAGQPPQAWLRSLRLDAAARWLAQGQPLEATALRCGYASASALAYALRRDRGVTARQLRG
ncbi:MAG: AraC family transcriptional regulator [Burkholderiaceae bacterium]|jgi:AraC-like DNA-binding protein/mannose-6-phosphate isomerase-like protein (cupin superfamily)|nr:AraC family transcriptional regulator [Burkholderiaceae bacterium]